MTQIPLTLATEIRDITPRGSKKIRFPEILSDDDTGSALTAALTTFPAAPVLIVETPDAAVYYMRRGQNS
jgi:hypothetical protein